MGVGLIVALPLSDNMVLSRVSQSPFSRFGWIRHGAILAFVRSQMQAYDIRAPAPEVRTGALSGGNLQKALLARELAFEPMVVIAAQPTRGLDVAAVEFVHGQLLAVRRRGGAVLLISEDLDELFALCDRIAVMYEGRIAGNLPTEQATRSHIGLLMTGAGA